MVPSQGGLERLRAFTYREAVGGVEREGQSRLGFHAHTIPQLVREASWLPG